MEGVGRLGRSSTRYGGPATVFTGPVRKWKKKWVHIPNPNNNNNQSSAGSGGNTNNNNSHLVLYKWTPVASKGIDASVSSNPSTPAGGGKEGGEVAEVAGTEEMPRRKFRYVPVSLFVEQTQEVSDSAKADDETTPNNADSSPMEQNENSDRKPGVDDVSMEEVEASAQDASETNLDLSLGLNAHDSKRQS